jgi:hypothetical protein
MNIADDLVSAFNDGYRQGREDAVVRGKWNPIFKGADTCECSVCKSEGFSDSDFGFIATPYCPNCGAKMEVEP